MNRAPIAVEGRGGVPSPPVSLLGKHLLGSSSRGIVGAQHNGLQGVHLSSEHGPKSTCALDERDLNNIAGSLSGFSNQPAIEQPRRL